MITYLHVAYVCGKIDGSSGSLFGDVVIRLGDGASIEDIRDWLSEEIRTNKSEIWNRPTILDCHELQESLALQLAPGLIADVKNDAFERGKEAGFQEGMRIGKIETLKEMPMWKRFSNNYRSRNPQVSKHDDGRDVLECGGYWIYIDELLHGLDLDD